MKLIQHVNKNQQTSGVNLGEKRLSGTILEIPWSELQADGPDTLTTKSLDSALSLWTIGGKQAVVAVKVCPSGHEDYSGVAPLSSCPSWLWSKGVSSASVSHNGQQQEVPIPWQYQFQVYFRQFLQQLAGRYDGNSGIAAWIMSCGHFCQATATYPDQYQSYKSQTGYTEAQWYAACRETVQDYCAAFTDSRLWLGVGDGYIQGVPEAQPYDHLTLARRVCPSNVGVGFYYHNLRGGQHWFSSPYPQLCLDLAKQNVPIALGLDNAMTDSQAFYDTYGPPLATVQNAKAVGASYLCWYAKDVQAASVQGSEYYQALESL